MVKPGVVLILLITFAPNTQQSASYELIKKLVTQWAPLIWMSPNEKYYPTAVENFLQNVHLANENGKTIMFTINETHFPQTSTRSLFLVTTRKLEFLQNGGKSFLNGHNPKMHSVPTYVIITSCTTNKLFNYSTDVSTIQDDFDNTLDGKTNPNLFFSATYWSFYPYNEGKEICFLGNVPTLKIFGRCFGHLKTIGSHVGDWEHMTLYFRGNTFPSEMYISIHNTGGYYKLDLERQHFKLNTQRSSRRVQQPKLPPIVRIQGRHPVLFAATGSHGLWPVSGEHEYVKIPHLTDKCGYGSPWKTWQNLKTFSLADQTLPKWLFFKGKWGNPKANCVLARKFGLCEYTDGPQGILRSRQEFDC